jgi:hypothetical protein
MQIIMKLHILDHYRCWDGRGITISVLLCLALGGCGSEDPHTSHRDKNTPTPPSAAETIKSEPAPEPAPPQHTIPAAIQNQVSLLPDASQPALNLEISSSHLESLQTGNTDILHQPAIQKRHPEKTTGKNLEIGAGIITDPEAQDLRDSLDGAEVKLDLKWD